MRRVSVLGAMSLFEGNVRDDADYMQLAVEVLAKFSGKMFAQKERDPKVPHSLSGLDNANLTVGEILKAPVFLASQQPFSLRLLRHPPLCLSALTPCPNKCSQSSRRK
jgi:hypothetical protein